MGLFMRKVSSILKKTVYFVLITALLVSSVSMGVFAANNDYAGPKILGISLNDTRSVITIQFNREIEAAVSSLKGRVKLSTDGNPLQALPSATNITISGFRMQINLTAPLETGDNYIQIISGTLVNQSIDLETSLFDARGPALADTKPVTVSSSGKKVTIKFKSAIKGYPNDESLKNGYISLARGGTSFNEPIPKDNIEIDGSKGEIEITLDEPLSGTRNRFKIAAGKVQTASSGNINLDDIITAYISYNASSGTVDPSDPDSEYVLPEIKSTSISSDLRTVTVYFTDRIKNAFATGVSASLAQTFLKSYVSIGRGSLNNFEYLSGADTITVGSNYVRIVFDSPLIDKNNYIKFHEGALTDYNNVPIMQDLITDSVTTSETAGSVPEYASVSLSGNNRVVVYFTTPVVKNSKLTQSQLLSSISVSRNGGTFTPLTSNDTVSFSGSTMTIKLSTPLSGSRNRVRIQANTLTSKVGLPVTTTITTGYMTYSEQSDDDYYVPEYDRVTYDPTNDRIRIYFANDIKFTSTTALTSAISLSRNGSSYKALSSNDVVTISPQNAISILLDEPLSGSKNAVKIAKGTLADYDTGYVLNEAITTEYINVDATGSDDDEPSDTPPASGSTQYAGDVEATLSEDFYTITLKFANPIYNNLNTLEALKERIQISRNGRFASLTENDYIRIDETENELLIVLAEPADEYFSQIKILPSALRNESGKALSNTITTLPLGEANGEARVYVNNIALPYTVPTETASTTLIATLSDESELTSLSKSAELLVKLPQDKSSATLNIEKSVVDMVKKNNGTFALSYGKVTYYLPASNISTLASGDTLSITINNSSTATQALSKAATESSFRTEASAVNMTASIIAASGSKTAIKHTAFAKKRVMVESFAGKNFFTVVRIENSGAVVPVPTNTDTTRGVAYLTANTLEDGNYAAISATHTFANTPTWVVGPANTLGSKLILANASGSDLNANQAISRSETVTIMTKTLGVFGDASGASPFFDMIPTDSYFNAVMSAVSHSLISGYPDGTFKPSGQLTRAEAMTIVARAMRFLDGKSVSQSAEMSDAEATAILSKFTDAGTVDNWAKKDIAECVQAGVVNGDNKGRLNPKANVTRAELIQLMYNLLSRKSLL